MRSERKNIFWPIVGQAAAGLIGRFFGRGHRQTAEDSLPTQPPKPLSDKKLDEINLEVVTQREILQAKLRLPPSRTIVAWGELSELPEMLEDYQKDRSYLSLKIVNEFYDEQGLRLPRYGVIIGIRRN